MKRNKVKFIKTLLLLSVFSVLTSCEKETDTDQLVKVERQLIETPITDHIVSLGFKKSGIKDMGDYYTISENDIEFKKAHTVISIQ